MGNKIFTIAFALLLLCSTTMIAQKLTISPGAGLAFPIADFADDDPENESAEFAIGGGQLGLGLNYKPTKNIGIALNVTYNNNSIDHNRTADILEKETGIEFTVTEESFETFFFLLGPSIGFFDKSVEISFQPGIGLGTVGYTQQQARAASINLLSRYSAGAESGLAWGCNFNTTVFVSDRIGIGFDLRYLGSNIERNYSSSITIGADLPDVELGVYDFKPSIISAGFDLAIRI
jgi:opacity protein-like surface antigen